jgi:hypothetical protein
LILNFSSNLPFRPLFGFVGVFCLLAPRMCFGSPPEDTHAVIATLKSESAEPPASNEVLPDAPTPNVFFMTAMHGPNLNREAVGDLMPRRLEGSPIGTDPEGRVTKEMVAEREIAREELNEGCETDRIRGKACKVNWWPILWQSFEWLTAQHSGNILLDSETRHDLTTNPYWSTYVFCVEHYRWYQWSDDTTFIVHDIGHPMMGAIVSSIFEQNDPKGRALVFENNGNYWRSRLKAMAYSAVYSAQWKVGPLSEASIGNSGRNTYYVEHLGRTTNETGFQDFVITPIYGFAWNVGEDAIDRYIMPKVHAHVKNRFYLTTLFWMTPCKSTANILRWKPTYYRDKAYSPLAARTTVN